MSILDQRKLIESIHPFELLSSLELDILMQKIDIAYYAKQTLLISKNHPSTAFHIIIKGLVNEYVEDELYNVYGEGDSFDADALIYHETQSKFVVDEDLICYEIKKEDFLDLMQNKKMQHYFLQDFVSRHQHLKSYGTHSEFTPFLLSKVSDIYLHNACVVKSDISIFEALQKMKEYQARVIIVKNTENKYSIVTDSNLIDNLLLGNIDKSEAISKIATKEIISISENDFLFNALLLMTHHSIKRVVVMKENRVVGVLEQLDLLSFFANHSHLIVVQIDKANSIDALKSVQKDLKNLILTLHAKGVKIRYMMKLISALNEKMYRKLFTMCVPEELQDKCCLIVMGSEGRAEQTLKTDQDNGLIIKDGVDEELFREPMLQLNEYLLEIGFPKCQGGVMVSNVYWRRSVHSFKGLLKSWSNSLKEENLQNLSILLDAKAVSGDEKLLEEIREVIQTHFTQRSDVLAHICKPVLNFGTPLSLLSSFVLDKGHNNKLDLKKGGIFALVHGLRILALEKKINAINTIERIKQLNNIGVFDKSFAIELIESFDTLSSIRLQAMLEAKDVEEGNYLNPKKLEKIQKDLLKDSFKVVNRFKRFLSLHFHLEMVS